MRNARRGRVERRAGGNAATRALLLLKNKRILSVKISADEATVHKKVPFFMG